MSCQTRANVGTSAQKLSETEADAPCAGLLELITSGGCTGCGCCRAVCPHGALAMGENGCGELVPRVNHEECTGCGRCERACPQIRPVELSVPQACYAAWAKSPIDREGSSSGGIGHLLASDAVGRGMAVCGCAMGDDAVARHVVLDSDEELEVLRGSKYVQSSTDEAFSRVADLLRRGRKVLFVGTPCQVAGLRRCCAGKRGEGLYTVDLICHGVPSSRYLKEHLRRQTGASAFSEVSFRNHNDYALRATPTEGSSYSGELGKDLYITAFMCGDICRGSCYACKYARGERVGDLTIGDFWGLDRGTLREEAPRSVSVVLQNTQKGAELVGRIAPRAVLEQRDLAEAVAGNDQLARPSRGTGRGEAFRQAAATMEFDDACRACGLGRLFLLRRIKALPIFAPLRAVKHALMGRG